MNKNCKNTRNLNNLKQFTGFCEKLDGFILAKGCYKFYEYHRALMYLEQHMSLTKKGLSDSEERDLLAVSEINIFLNF